MRTRLAVLLFLVPVLLGASGLSPQEENGKRIYLEGAGSSGAEITAVMGEGVEVPASAVPCAGCHGRDGRGRPPPAPWPRLGRRCAPPWPSASTPRPRPSSGPAGASPASG